MCRQHLTLCGVCPTPPFSHLRPRHTAKRRREEPSATTSSSLPDYLGVAPSPARAAMLGEDQEGVPAVGHEEPPCAGDPGPNDHDQATWSYVVQLQRSLGGREATSGPPAPIACLTNVHAVFCFPEYNHTKDTVTFTQAVFPEVRRVQFADGEQVVSWCSCCHDQAFRGELLRDATLLLSQTKDAFGSKSCLHTSALEASSAGFIRPL